MNHPSKTSTRIDLAAALVAATLSFTATACGPALEPVASPKSATPGDELISGGFVALGQRHGITLYRRDRLPGFELAAEGDLPGSPERVKRVLLDYPAHQKWQQHLVECKVLGQGPDWLDVYERLGLPVIEDRDYTLHVTWGADDGVLWTKFATTMKNGPAPVDGVTRVHAHQGGWRLAPIQNGSATHAVYKFHLDLESDMTSAMGTGQAESDLVELFAQITAQLPSYP